jgi:HK97 family phage major capsid protein
MAVQELLQKRAALIAKQEEILITARKENRNPSVDEWTIYNNMAVDVAGIEQTIEATKNVMNRLSSLDETYNPINLNQEVNNQQHQPEEMSFGEMCVAAAAQVMPSNKIHNANDLLARASKIRSAAAGASANVPADGGFFITPTRSSELMKKIYEGGAITSKCATYEVGDYSDSFEIPYEEEASRANGSRWGGLRAYREGEVDTPTSSKSSYGLWECRVTDLKALVYITERLLNDAPALESYILERMPDEFNFKLEDELLNGGGGIQCKGVIGDVATVSVTKETGQAADTVLYENIIKMWSRQWGRSRANSAWYYNQNIEPQLFAMTLSSGTAGVPVFLPANGLSGSPYATLLGRSLVPVEQAASIGDVGDITLADFSQYALIRKGGLKSASSIHVKFITDEMTFKFNMRDNGKPKWKSVLTPFKSSGSDTLSPFVTLGAR